jgi:hypothetical protein
VLFMLAIGGDVEVNHGTTLGARAGFFGVFRFAQRALTAFRADSRRSSFVMLFARAFPPSDANSV